MYVLDFLRSRDVWFEALLHHPASSSAKRAQSVHVPGRSVAKAVLIKAGDSFVLAMLPSTSRIDLCRLSEVLGRLPRRSGSPRRTSYLRPFRTVRRESFPLLGGSTA